VDPLRRGAAVATPRGRADGPLSGASNSPTPVISTRSLTKRYDDVPAVDSLDLDVDAGVLYGFLGPNGAGKTTTIRMALGLIRATSGTVRILGEPVRVAGETQRVLAGVGALIEEPAFWGYLSGRLNLEYFARAAGPADDRARRLGRIDETLATVGLADAAGKKVKAYSQGMRQRLGIALSLLGDPQLLVLDEPTNGLDPQGMREVRTLLRRLADGGTTVFVSSHLLSEVEAMCDRVGVLAHGRLVAQGSPSDLRAGSNVVRVEVDDRVAAQGVLASMRGVDVEPSDGEAALRVRLSDGLAPADVNEALVRGGVRVNALGIDRASLEDVFLSLVEGDDVPR
jgi:ABC-type multidrug transport system ATPase subunit